MIVFVCFLLLGAIQVRLRYVSTGAASILAVALVLLLANGFSDSTSVKTQGYDAVPFHPINLAEEGAGEGEATEEKSVGIHVDYGVLSPEEREYLADPVKYSTEHPEEAQRFHLKRKAERQAALREEYKRKREETLERLSETNRARNVVIAILATIVIITVLIDMVCVYVIEHSNDFSRPVVEILFKELTVLGCIALFVFMSVKTGIPEELSSWVSCVLRLSGFSVSVSADICSGGLNRGVAAAGAVRVCVCA